MTDRHVPELTASQAEILDPAVRVVEAGPGAGKTRALTARFITEVQRDRRGVAFVSFTNAAVQEVKTRTAQFPAARLAPHFIGTIDSFLHRFIVTPTIVAELGRAPTYLSSWDDLASHLNTTVRLFEVPGCGIELARFTLNGESARIAVSLGNQERGYLEQVDQAGCRAALLSRAAERIRSFHESGIFDSASARTYAYAALAGLRGPVIYARLSARFHLLLVDEVQDCDAAEIEVFRGLGKHIPTVLVADPEQGIYEFRGSAPHAFAALRDSYPVESQRTLLENHRSSSAICDAVSSLRSAGSGKITPVRTGACEPVLLISGKTQQDVGAKFVIELDRVGISSDSAIVIAHNARVAFEVAGRSPPKGSQAVGNRLAEAAFLLAQRGHPPKARLAAMADTERVILSLFDWPKAEGRTRDHQLDLLQRDAYWLRSIAGDLLTRLREAADPKKFGEAARTILADALARLPLTVVPLGSRVKRPDQEVWDRGVAGAKNESRLAADSVHQVKGREFAAVLIALYRLPSSGGRNVLDDWNAGQASERRRVLYVAASRPEHLLAFGGPAPTVKRVSAILEKSNVQLRRL
jgi:DNA helicase-2/ATP-dependent DNA helicase PcrA